MKKLIVEIDGNDGVGKTYFIEQVKRMLKEEQPENFSKVVFKDRGDLTVATLSPEFDKSKPDFSKVMPETFDMKNKLYFVIDDDPTECQKRILSRGDSIDVPYHNMVDLKKFRNIYHIVCNHFKIPMILRHESLNHSYSILHYRLVLSQIESKLKQA